VLIQVKSLGKLLCYLLQYKREQARSQGLLNCCEFTSTTKLH
jgi:hypothetical protein